jgi:hypothetical protein
MSDIRFRFALQYHMRAGFYTFAAANLANFAFTHMKTGKGKWLWDNDQEAFDEKTGMKSRLELPYNRPDGRRLFMDVFRQFAEPWVLINNPPHFAKSKMGTLPRVATTLVLGQDGFGNEIAGEKDGPYDDIVKRFGHMGLQWTPIAGQQLIRAAQGGLTPGSLVMSTLGFPIQSESLRGFQQRQRLDALKLQLAQENELAR